MNRGHYQYNENSEEGEFVCNGHYPQDSAEIVCLDEKSATWLRANATFPGVHWHHARMLVVGSTEDALRIVGKAVRDGLRVTTNHIPAVADAGSAPDDTQSGPALDGPAGRGYYFGKAPDGRLYPFDPGAAEQRTDRGMDVQEPSRRLREFGERPSARPSKTRTPYRFGNRPFEKIAAFLLTLTAIFWFAWKNETLSLSAGTGLLDGASAAFFIRIIGLRRESVKTGLLMAAMILIGLKYGITAFGAGLLGCLTFTALLIGMVLLGSAVLSIFKI
jgi:hypothetical protein